MLFCDFAFAGGGVDEVVRSENRPTWHEATDGRTENEGRRKRARGKNRPTYDEEEERTCEREHGALSRE